MKERFEIAQKIGVFQKRNAGSRQRPLGCVLFRLSEQEVSLLKFKEGKKPGRQEKKAAQMGSSGAKVAGVEQKYVPFE